MKTRESGMPGEGMWEGFFDAGAILVKLGLGAESGDVVDFGCGYGTFCVPAAKITRGCVYAMDIEQEMVEATRARAEAAHLGNIRVCRRDFVDEGTGLAEGGAGYVMLFNILHCEKPEALLREAWRVLRAGGVLAVMHWNYDASTPRGPRMEIRPRPEQCREWAVEVGFKAVGAGLIDLRPYHYGMRFLKP